VLIRGASPGGSADCCAIAVMAKASEPGRTKTRLSPPLTPVEAAALNTAFLADINANLAVAAAESKIARFMAFGPPRSAPFFHDLVPAEVGLLETWLPDFGDCLLYAVRSLLDLGYGAACVLNSDSPTLPTALLVAAAEALRPAGDRIVLGPSTDGGYYLLGMRHPHRRLFEDIAWSTAAVAEQTLQRATELGLETVMLPPWYDVDDAASLRQLVEDAAGTHPFSAVHHSFAAHRSAALLLANRWAGAVTV
jgi:rSAM/selenodomain-associated transferase 1